MLGKGHNIFVDISMIRQLRCRHVTLHATADDYAVTPNARNAVIATRNVFSRWPAS